MRRIISTIAAFVLLAASASSVVATKPNPDHKVTICHAHPADTAAAGFVGITVDVASVGYQQSGHQDQHDADIIPAYSYTDTNGVEFSYPGKNLGTLFFGTTGLTILNNGCQLLDTETPTSVATPTATPESSGSPLGSPSASEPTVPTPDTAVFQGGDYVTPVVALGLFILLGLVTLVAIDRRKGGF